MYVCFGIVVCVDVGVCVYVCRRLCHTLTYVSFDYILSIIHDYQFF